MKRAVVVGVVVAVPAIVALDAVAAAPAQAVEIPGVGLVTDAIGGVAGWSFDRLASGVTGWVLSGVAWFADGVLNFLKTSARPDVEAAWFAGPGSPMATVRNLAGVLLAGFVFLGLIHGLVRGDPAGMVRRVASDLPLAVLGMAVTVAVVARLLDLTDALSTAVLDQADGQALQFLGAFGGASAGASGFAVVVVGLLAIAAGLMLWIELLVRSALVYLLVAISPLAFAATVWPAARGVLRRTAHLLLAVILSKFVIAVALAVGVAALGGRSDGSEAAVGVSTLGGSMASGPGPLPDGDPATALGALLVGAVILALAAFAPFLVLRLIPIAEAALAAQGVSRGPMRATQAGLGTYYYANSLTRLGGSGAATPGAPPGASAKPGATPSPIGTTGSASGRAAGGSAAAGGGVGAGAGAARAAGRRATATARQAGDSSPAPMPPTPPEGPPRLEQTPLPPDRTRRTP